MGAVPASFENFFGAPSLSTVRDDYTFEFTSWPGPVFVRLISRSPDSGMKAIRLQGVDVTDKAIECREGQDIEKLEIELTNKVSQVSGVVTTNAGDAVASFVVMFFSQDRERWQDSRYVAVERPDQYGRFVVRSLPPGRYYAIASNAMPQGDDWGDPEFFERIREQSIRFSLSEGESKTLQLVLIRTR